jgi:hypothetical protein
MPFNPYTDSVPNSTDTISGTQPTILDNFTSLDQQFAVNHVALTSASNNGKHNFCSFPVQAADPATTTTECAFYSKALPSTKPALFMRQNNSGSVFQMSGKTPTYTAGPPVQGSTFLPGGLLLQYGWIQVASGATKTITFPYTFSAVPYSVTIAQERSSGNFPSAIIIGGSVTAGAGATFKLSSSSGDDPIYWMAIGPQ